MKLFLVMRPQMVEIALIPVYNYIFAETKEEAINKVRLKWGEYDDAIIANELTQNEIIGLVIGTDYDG